MQALLDLGIQNHFLADNVLRFYIQTCHLASHYGESPGYTAYVSQSIRWRKRNPLSIDQAIILATYTIVIETVVSAVL